MAFAWTVNQRNCALSYQPNRARGPIVDQNWPVLGAEFTIFPVLSLLNRETVPITKAAETGRARPR